MIFFTSDQHFGHMNIIRLCPLISGGDYKEGRSSLHGFLQQQVSKPLATRITFGVIRVKKVETRRECEKAG